MAGGLGAGTPTRRSIHLQRDARRPPALSAESIQEIEPFVAKEKTPRLALADFTPCEYNPRLITDGQRRRLQASIREHTNTLAGWSAGDGFRMATTITVNRNGRRIVGGTQRVRALESLGQDWIHPDDITWVDVVPGSALEKSLNLSLNNREAQGVFDGAKLSGLLEDIQLETPDLFAGLELDLVEAPGMKDSAVNAGAAAAPLPDGAIPEGNYREQYGVIVLCADEQVQKTVYEDLLAQGYTCRVVTT